MNIGDRVGVIDGMVLGTIYHIWPQTFTNRRLYGVNWDDGRSATYFESELELVPSEGGK